MNTMIQLLDNGWQILLQKQVDGKYVAATKKPFCEDWKDVFETVTIEGVECGLPADDFERSQYKGPRMPHRIATGTTPDEALERLVDSVLGLSGETP
jgi:hypothetical protein